MLFQGLEFLLTGFSSLKTKELETLIRKHGGDILFDVPSPSAYSRRNRESSCKSQQLPIVLSAKKVSALELTSAFYFFICQVGWDQVCMCVASIFQQMCEHVSAYISPSVYAFNVHVLICPCLWCVLIRLLLFVGHVCLIFQYMHVVHVSILVCTCFCAQLFACVMGEPWCFISCTLLDANFGGDNVVLCISRSEICG